MPFLTEGFWRKYDWTVFYLVRHTQICLVAMTNGPKPHVTLSFHNMNERGQGWIKWRTNKIFTGLHCLFKAAYPHFACFLHRLMFLHLTTVEQNWKMSGVQYRMSQHKFELMHKTRHAVLSLRTTCYFFFPVLLGEEYFLYFWDTAWAIPISKY